MRAMQRGCREEEPPQEQVAVEPVELERARDGEGVREERHGPRLPRAQRGPANETVQGFLSLRRGVVLQQLLRHEKRSCWAGRRAAQRGGSAVPRQVQRGSFLFAEVVLGVVVVVVLWMLDAGHGVDVALRSSASARAAARVARWSGGGAGHPASETFGARTGHGRVEAEDVPQPPTWRAKCWRTAPGTGRVSLGMNRVRG